MVGFGKARTGFGALYNNTPIMMHSVDRNGCILDVNEFWLQTLGYERSEVIGRPVVNFTAPEYQTYVREDLMPNNLSATASSKMRKPRLPRKTVSGWISRSPRL